MCVCALFSPEILQVGAVKGLIKLSMSFLKVHMNGRNREREAGGEGGGGGGGRRGWETVANRSTRTKKTPADIPKNRQHTYATGEK